jgi:Cof subfamily protein (haloacid dehalogenase superfamily)
MEIGMDNKIYAIFLDIDGTLISHGRIPERNKEAIARVQEMGHKVFINTGRSYANIPGFVLEEIRFDGVVAGIGSYVRYGNEVLQSISLTDEQLTQLTEFYFSYGKTCIIEGEDEIFCINLSDPQGRIVVEPGDDIPAVYKRGKISKINVYGPMTPEEKALVETEYAYWAHDNYLEFTTKGCNKAQGMKVVLDYLSLGRESCIAVGDSKNDIDMLQFAGISVAMGNAPEDIKEMCDVVTDTAENAGVAAALEKLIINPTVSGETSISIDNSCDCVDEIDEDEIA